ncbi:hypothetical protein KCU73_g4263, partial [Aureobasidium melanogenum]
MAASSISQEELEELRDDYARSQAHNTRIYQRYWYANDLYKSQQRENKELKKLLKEKSQVIAEQNKTIKKLEKRIAKMEGREKIKEDISKLEKQLKKRKRELELAEDEEDSESRWRQK